MVKKNRVIIIILLLTYFNVYLIYDLIDAVLTNGNFWIPIIVLLLEIATIIIYRYIGQFGEKFGTVDHNPTIDH
jgi:hypothetical protein